MLKVTPVTLLRLERRDPNFPAPFRSGRVVRYDPLAIRRYLGEGNGPRRGVPPRLRPVDDAMLPPRLRRRSGRGA